MPKIEPKQAKNTIDNNSQKKVDTSYLIKIALCGAALFLSAIVFFQTCRDLDNNYLLLLAPDSSTIPWLIKLATTSLLLSITAGIVALLVRPIRIAFAFFLLASTTPLFIMKPESTALIMAAIMGLFLCTYLVVSARQLKNQIKFSTHPLSDLKVIFFTILGVMISISFGLGYYHDSTAKSYVIPPQIKTAVVNQIVSQAKITIDAQKDVPLKFKQQALSDAQKKSQALVDDYEKQAKPYAQSLPYILGALLFFVTQIVFIILAIISSVIIKPIFFILRKTNFAHTVTETLEGKRLTLIAASKSTIPTKKAELNK